MELQLEGIRVLPTTHAETNANKMRPRFSRAVRLFTRVYLHAHTAVGLHTHLTNHSYFDRGKTRIPPIWAPWRDKDCAGSGIFGLYLVVQSEVTSTWSKINVLMYLFCSHRMCYVFVCARFVSTYFRAGQSVVTVYFTCLCRITITWNSHIWIFVVLFLFCFVF